MGNALICKQILLTNSRKCMGISLESLYVDIGALYFGDLRVNLALGTQETCTL